MGSSGFLRRCEIGHGSLDAIMIYTKPSYGDLEKVVRKAAGELLD
jgi:hypothetical protein